MACPDDNALAEYLEGTLSAADRTRIEAHLDRCPNCHATLADLAALTSAPSEPSPLEEAALGRYEPVRVVGRGGMSLVYEGRDRVLQRKVAIKVLHRADAETSLLREAEALAKLSHPNVVEIYDAAVRDGRLFIVTALVSGETLGAWMQQRRSLADVVEVIAASAAGLAAAHRNDVLHLDVTPGNILIANDGRVLVADFGLSRLASDTSSGFGGTPGYVAPELARGQTSPAADQYGLAVTAHEALEATQRRIPRALHRVLRRALEDDPTRRYPSVEAFAEALQRAAAARWRRWAVLPAAASLVLLAWPSGPACPEDPLLPEPSGVPAFDSAAEHAEQAWTDARARTCSAELEPEAADRRWACLRGYARAVRALADGLRGAEATSASRALLSLEDLGSALRCEDDDLLSRGFSPDGPTAAPLHEALARARAALDLGEVPLAELERLHGEAQALGAPGLLAEVSLAAGYAASRSHQLETARDYVSQCIELATAYGADAVAVRAWFARVMLDGHEAMDRHALEASVEFLDAAMDRADASPRTRARRNFVLGSAYSRLGDHAAAAPLLERAVAGLEQADGSSLTLANALEALGVHRGRLGEIEAARTALEQARTMMVEHLGSGSLREAEIVVNLAGLAMVSGDYASAAALARAGIEVYEDAPEQGGMQLATLYGTLGQSLRFDGRDDEAQEALRRALELKRDRFGDDHPVVVDARYQLGAALRTAAKLEEAREVLEPTWVQLEREAVPLQLRGLLQYELGELALAAGDTEAAHRACGSAMEILEQRDDTKTLPAARRCRDEAQGPSEADD